MDKLFRVSILAQTPEPQRLIYAAMRQDYGSRYVGDISLPDETRCGDLACKKLLAGNRGHYGPLEHPAITFAIGYFPHSTMQQVSRHRVGISIDCQSFRYTGDAIMELGEKALAAQWENGIVPLEDGLREQAERIFYLRPLGIYFGRESKVYEYKEEDRDRDLQRCLQQAGFYYTKVKLQSCSYEQARGNLPFDLRQHWVMSFNLRSLLHLFDLRWKKDAQLECQQLCDLLFENARLWCPEIMDWYETNRAHKGVLAP